MAIKNLLLGYRFEGNVADFSGNGRTGTANNNTVLATGKFGQCYDFNGTDDYITVPITATVKGLTAATVCAWFNLDNLPGTAVSMFIYMESTTTVGFARFGLRAIESSGSVYIRGSWRDADNDPTGTGYAATGTTALSADTWYHGAFVFDSVNDSHKVYLNGVVDGTSTQAAVAFANTDPNRIGIGGYEGDATPVILGDFDGTIDEVQVFNYALAESDIRRVMLGKLPLH